jgi:hypothetical protein
MAKIERVIEFLLSPAKMIEWIPVVFFALFNGCNLYSYLTYDKPLISLLSGHMITPIQRFLELSALILTANKFLFPSLLEILINRGLIHRQMDDESIAWLVDKRLEWKDLTPTQAKRREALFLLACSWGVFKYRIELVVNKSLMKIK